MKISIITPSYNSGHAIEKAVRSVLNQGYENIEHVIVDGGSTDNTRDILKKYDHLTWISEPDNGQVEAMNKGFGMSTGEVIAYLNADDFFLDNVFGDVIECFKTNAMIVMGRVLVKQHQAEGVREWINNPKTDFASMIRHWEPDAFCVNPVGYFYRREVQDKIPFREASGAKHDLEFLIEAAFHFPIRKIDRVLGVFNDTLDTQTAREQLLPSYWQPENFSFIDRLAEHLPPDRKRQFFVDRKTGYRLRRQWAFKEAVKNKMVKDLFEKKEIILFPQDDSNIKKKFVEHNLPVFRGDDIILVMSQGKVASKSIQQAIQSVLPEDIEIPVYQFHHMNPASIDRNIKQKSEDIPEHYLLGKSLKHIYDCSGNLFMWKFITGVREPVALAISSVFENENKALSEETVRVKMQPIVKHLMNGNYFNLQFRDTFGIDIFEHEFDPDKGYGIIKAGNIEIFIYRLESLSKYISTAISEFLGISEITIPKKNVGEQKDYAESYETLKKTMRFDKDFLDRVYGSKLIRHFYSDDEAEQFHKNWLDDGPRKKQPDTGGQQLRPILIYQMGKVGSKSVEHSLKMYLGERLYRDTDGRQMLWHIHRMSDAHLKIKENSLKEQFNEFEHKAYEWSKKVRAEVDTFKRHGCSIITMTREPISLMVSAFFENMFWQNPDLIEDGRINIPKSLKRIQDQLDRVNPEKNSFLTWFEDELKTVFDIDIYQYNYDFESGYTIIRKDNIDLLVIRLEDLDDHFSEAMKQFMGFGNIKLVRDNVGDGKFYSGDYKLIKNRLKLTKEVCDKIYSARYVRHFYRPEEIDNLISYWCDNPK